MECLPWSLPEWVSKTEQLNLNNFCSLHNKPDNYLKGIINSALKRLDDTPQPKSKAVARWIVFKCNRRKGSTKCDYYVMHWMSTIILGKRLKALRIQWTQYYLKVKNQT
ncbi:hypothetical protein GmHk_17G049084 [Glycine max]|nr:hypothetical protein GmHk_17G049084 [Glycine max]